MISIRFARRGDETPIIEFIRDHWSSTHIFVGRPEVFEWQHQQADGRLNAVIAEETGDDGTVLIGLLGFIPTGRFDESLGDRDVALAIWKVRETGVPPGVGLRLLKFLQTDLNPRVVMAIGISDIVVPIYKLLRYQVGEMRQSALFHPGRRGDIVVAAGVPPIAFDNAPSEGASVELIPVDDSSPAELLKKLDAVARAGVPAKSWAYITERYLRHPWYRYELRAVSHDGAITAVVVWRAVTAAGRVVLRIVDIVGDVNWLAAAGPALREEVVAADAEYIDLVEWGVDPDLLTASGFVDPSAHRHLVIPNYFSPFERRNITIGASLRQVGDDASARMFRADSDQDRPNVAVDLGDPE